MKDHFRSHKMSIWLNLIPKLERTGRNSIYSQHDDSLDISEGPSWGVVRNASHVQASLDKDIEQVIVKRVNNKQCIIC